VCCSVVQCVAMLLQCVAMLLQCVVVWCRALQYGAVHYSVVLCVAVCCSAIESVAHVWHNAPISVTLLDASIRFSYIHFESFNCTLNHICSSLHFPQKRLS